MRVLLVEDDRRLADSLKFQLEQEGFTVDFCEAGDDGLYYIKESAYDLVILDRMLPGMDGIEMLEEARRQGITTPVILLTALGELEDRIHGLDAGADDYMVKPFAFGELMARIRSVSRRPRRWGEAQSIHFGDLDFAVGEKRLKGPGGECLLSKKEGELLEAFLRNPCQILTRETLLLRVWGPEAEVEGGNLDNYIHFLRRRLRAIKSAAGISTVRGVGYRMEDAPKEE